MAPVRRWCLLVLSVLARHLVPAGCYANGKVTDSCGSMKPNHHSYPGETSPSPYHLETNTTVFRPKDQIQVVVSGTTFFQGFLLQARDAANQDSESALGSFTLTDTKWTQLLTCSNSEGSAVSHTHEEKLTNVVVVWTAPENAPTHVQFFATVVHHFSKFWEKLPGPVVSQPGASPLPTPPPTTPGPAQTTTTPSILPGPFSSEGCGESKSCLQDPPGCDPKGDPQCFFLSMATDGASQSSVTFELSGPAEGYISFALSRDIWMGDDDLYMCVNDGTRVSVYAAFVSGRTHPVNGTQSGLSSVSWRLEDGAIQCRFSRPVKLGTQDPDRFDLDQEHFLFLADGRAENGKVFRHHRQPSVSVQKKLITGPAEILKGSRSPTILKAHGALMLLAWMLTGSVGTFVASFYKPDWSNHSLFGQKIWFQVHRGLMVLTVTLTVVAFCLPFFYRKGWSKHAGAHPYLGCCVLILSLIQPVMSAARPSPDSHRRFLFNWAHWGVGYTAEILAVAAMFLGTGQSTLLLPQPWATHVLIGYVAWLASFRILLLAHKYFYNQISAVRPDDKQGIVSDLSLLGRWAPVLKSGLLAVLALGNAGLLMALFSSIVLV
ncbi:uncharacterized protein V6R79_008306 [Siganus canaliculatus]